MYIKQVLNNNVVIALDESNNEIIVVAKGIGFKNKSNSIVDENGYYDLRRYVLDSTEYDQIRKVYDDIPSNILKLSSELLEKEKKQKAINAFIPITAVMLLADHLNATIERLKKGMYLRNALTNEIKMFYKDEYDISISAKTFIMEEYGLLLNEDEIAFIAIHLINLNSNNIHETITSIQIVDDLVNIVRRIMNIELKINTYTYTRFITHLKYFALRILNNEKINSVFDKKLEVFVKENYKQPYLCALTMKNYIEKNYKYKIANDEVIYLALHLENLEREDKKL